MDSFESKMISVVSVIDEIQIPSRPKGVKRGNYVLVPKSCHRYPKLASLEHYYRSPKAVGVSMDWADRTLSPN